MDRSEWVLVPKVPTGAMVQASDDISRRAEGREHWAAMIAAAPTPPAEQDCKCECHRNLSIQHFVPCCTPPAEQASGEIQRWRATGDYAFPAEEADDGEFVDYDDHVAAIAALSRQSEGLSDSEAVRPVVGEVERDSDRLDYIEREGISVSCQWKNTGWAGGPKWQAYVYGTGGKVFADGDTLRATIDALAPRQQGGS